jgi:hypothetical protein
MDFENFLLFVGQHSPRAQTRLDGGHILLQTQHPIAPNATFASLSEVSRAPFDVGFP